jgi:RNA polymerase sigma-70 factor (ECF subfamily)
VYDDVPASAIPEADESADRTGPRAAPATGPGVARRMPAGDEPLGRLLQALRPRMVAVALRFTREPDVAQDVVQSAFEKAIRHRDQFRGRARVSTWLHRIVANEALMWLRAERRRARRTGPLSDAEPEALADPAPDAAAELTRAQDARALRREIARLDADDRDVIEGCLLRGRSYAEYGAERGVHPAAAKSRAFRARRRLEARLREA